MKEKKGHLPDEVIISIIYIIRNHKVMIDRDLAELYGVETRILKQAVKRNIRRFPRDFMFEMSGEEFATWRKDNLLPKEKMGLRYLPFCFTEQGVTMLACVLSSERAIDMNVRIIRIFTRLREMLLSHKDLLLKVEQLEGKVASHDENIAMIFRYLKELLNPPPEPMRKIGFKQKG